MTTATDIAKRLLEDEEDFDPKEYAMAQKYFLQPIEHGVNKEACAVTLNLSYASSIGLIVQLHSNDWVAQPMLNRQSIGLDQHTFKTKQEAANWVYKAYEEWSKLDLPEAEEEEIDHKDYIMSQLYAQPPHTGDIIGPGGKTVVRSRNLAGVRRYLRNHLVTRVNIWQFVIRSWAPWKYCSIKASGIGRAGNLSRSSNGPCATGATFTACRYSSMASRAVK